MKIGSFLVENNIITLEQLKSALDLQKDNQERVIGEILVTQGIVTREDIIMAMEMYMVMTGKDLSRVNEWLDQEEIDLLMTKIKEKK